MAKIINRKIVKYTGKVYDLEVENSHSYNIEGLGVHNSACGCLLTWCLDITKIDPIRFGLYFERFLNPTRKCITKNNDVLMKDGTYKNVMDITLDDKFNIQTEKGIGVLVEIIDRELQSNESIYEIETECGAIVELTGNHIVPVFRDSKKIEIRVDEILDTDFLITL